MKNYKKGIESYTNAIKRLLKSKKIKLNINDFNDLSIFYSNRALCNLKINEHRKCINDCNESIKYNHKFIKSYYRRAQSYEAIANYKMALIDYKNMKKYSQNENDIKLAKTNINRINKLIN